MAPPANDAFASAEIISGASGSTPGTTFDATMEASESTTIGSAAQSVWYKFTAPSTGWFRFYILKDELTYHGSQAFDATFVDFRLWATDTLANLTATSAIAYAFSQGDKSDVNIAAKLTSGTDYYIRINSNKQFAITNYSTCDFTLRWETISAPGNDDLANATSIASLPAALTDITTRNSTPETGEATNLGGVGSLHQSRWYKLTPATTGRYRISVEANNAARDGILSDESTLIFGYLRGTIGTVSGGVFTPQYPSQGFTQLSVITPVTGAPQRLAFYPDLTASTEYHLLLASGWEQKHTNNYQFNRQTVNIDLDIELISPPSNDDYADAIALSTTLPGSLTGLTTYDATQESGENLPGTSGDAQSIWFTFTPTVTGLYRFRIPFTSIAYDGDQSSDQGFIAIAVTTGADATAATNNGANFLPSAGQYDAAYTDPGWINVHSPARVVNLTSGVTYRILIWSYETSNQFNRNTASFDLEWDQITPPSNDAFADRINFSGSSGTQAFQLEGGTTEASEPYPFYWYEGWMSNIASVWFDWTAPSSGWFEFRIETDENAGSPAVGIYTGTAIGSLTPIARNEGGTHSDIDTNDGCTTIRFNATSGTNYKFQIAMSAAIANSYAVYGTITWATASAPTGETTTVALTPGAGFQRVNNFGNTNDELPPNAVTRLSAHDDWWYTDGAIGRSKWWKYTSPGNINASIRAFLYQSGDATYSEYAILCYKGANFASLTDATTTLAEDAVMIGYGPNEATTPGNNDGMLIALTTGEELWVCLVSLYDLDYPGGNTGTAVVEVDAPQLELDLLIDADEPLNDERAPLLTTLVNSRDYWLGRSDTANWFPDREASQGTGTTIGATAAVGDPTVAGFAATRNVWYLMHVPKEGVYKIWVESAVDCVLGIYDYDGTATLGALIAEDDDSGTGNQPEITHDFSGIGTTGHYWVVVDSKTAGDFTIKYQRQHDVGASPPTNDDFASAEVILAIPFSTTGTTVDANAEPEEHDSTELGVGPKDTVWYKYVAASNGALAVTCDQISNNWDGYVYVDVWRGTTLANLVLIPNDWPNGVFYNGDTLAENKTRSALITTEAGQTYYIRVQTEEGGSEDFTIYVDEAAIYVDIQPSGSEEMHGTLIDSAEIYIDIQVSSVEVYDPAETLDSATVYIDIQPSGVDFPAKEYLDAATVYFAITIDSHDCHTVWDASQLTAYCRRRLEARAYSRWLGTMAYRRFEVIAGDGLEEC